VIAAAHRLMPDQDEPAEQQATEDSSHWTVERAVMLQAGEVAAPGRERLQGQEERSRATEHGTA